MTIDAGMMGRVAVGLALAAALLPASARADGKIKASLVSVPTTFDAGSDPTGSGANTHPNFPSCGGAVPEPAHGLCMGGNAAGSACRRDGDPCGDVGVCVAYANDGVTAADVASDKRLIPKRSSCSLNGTTLSFKVAFEGEGPDGQDFSAIDTDGNESGGVCDNNNAIACRKDRDCGQARACVGGAEGYACDDDGDCFGGTCTGELPAEHQPGGACVSGDEYWVQALVYVGSNLDDGDGGDHQACAPDCLGSYNTMPQTCRLGTCAGGTRDGLACSGTSFALGGTCPGGTCQLGSYAGHDSTPADSDEVVLDIPFGGGVGMKLHCPFVVGLSIPFEVSKGKGKGKADLAWFDAFVPPTVRVALEGCFVHDQAGLEGGVPAGELAHAMGFGVLEPGAEPSSGNHAPCADKTVVIHEDGAQGYATAGNEISINTPVSPILGTIGLTTSKLRCDSDGKCGGGRCCGGTCVEGSVCPGE